MMMPPRLVVDGVFVRYAMLEIVPRGKESALGSVKESP